MTALTNLHSIRRRCGKLCILATLILIIAEIPNVLEATESESAREQQTGLVVRNQTGSTRENIVIGGDARLGKGLFEQHCVTCHGPRGRGDGLEIAGATVADLSSAATQRKLNVELLATIHEGRPGKVMPSWEYKLSKTQSRDILAYIRTLRRK